MTTKLIFTLLTAVTLAWADSFTLTAYAPSSPLLHNKRINANNNRFLIGLAIPSSFCPLLSHIACPAGTSTTVDEDLTHMRVSTPGGQTIYVASDGVVSYTRAHSASFPAGAMMKGFYRKAVPPAFPCSAAAAPRLLGFLSTDGANLTGIYACPNPDPKETWLLVTAGRRSRALGGDCVALVGLELRRSEIEIGAWQY